jgi:hypothetical protein
MKNNSRETERQRENERERESERERERDSEKTHTQCEKKNIFRGRDQCPMGAIAYHAKIVARFAAIIVTNVHRKCSGITVVLKGLLMATGYVVTTNRTAFCNDKQKRED